MAVLPQQLSFDQLQTKWASLINPLLANPILQGLALKNVSLTAGSNSINHLLGQTQQGWIVTDINAPAKVYRSAPFNASTLTLTSDIACIVSLWVY